MAATLFVIHSERGEVTSARGSRKAAEAVAARIGGSVHERVIEAGERVRIFFHGHERTAEVVEAKGASLVVRFHQGATGVVTKTVSVEKVEVR